MGNHELLGRNSQPDGELCFSNHFYAAYVFDQAESHEKDITTIIEESQHLGYAVRYWWLSQAMDIQNSPDRLIICIHHPSSDENAGMDLYDVLQGRQVSYDELDAAVMAEYKYLGKKVDTLENLTLPGGAPLFPSRQD
jgi:hypothetical protein